MKACKDCKYYREYLENYKRVCYRTATYEKFYSVLDGHEYTVLTDVRTIYLHRETWPIFGGCGKMAIYFNEK